MTYDLIEWANRQTEACLRLSNLQKDGIIESWSMAASGIDSCFSILKDGKFYTVRVSDHEDNINTYDYNIVAGSESTAELMNLFNAAIDEITVHFSKLKR